MDILAIFVTLVGLGTWTGASVFWSFFVVPALNRRLTPGKTSELMETLGARYYWTGFGAGVFMLAGAGTALFDEDVHRLPTITFIGLTALALVLLIYAWLVVLPRTVSLRKRLQSSAGSTENFVLAERFDQAHRLSSFFNVVILLLLVGAAGALAALLLPSMPRH
jgi:uncharacterized membrane protein